MKPFSHKDLLDIKTLKASEIFTIIDTTRHFKNLFTRSMKKLPVLRGKTVANLFYESSTRTKTSFELAAKRLGADIINIDVGKSSITKGESLIDTVKTLSALKADYIVIRHSSPLAPHLIARNFPVSVINGGDGYHSHPTQGLLDAYTICEKLEFPKDGLRGKTIGIVGDILHSRVARSNIHTLKKLGAKVVVCGPLSLIPKEIDKFGIEVSTNLDTILPKLDAINMLRIQFERHADHSTGMTRSLFLSMREYQSLFSLNAKRLKKAKKELIILHPGPINRGIEIDDEVADSAKSMINVQVTNGVAVRMAVFYLFRPPVLNGKKI